MRSPTIRTFTIASLAVLTGGLLGTYLAMESDFSSLSSQVSTLQGRDDHLAAENQELSGQLSAEQKQVSSIKPVTASSLGICYNTSTQTFSNLYDSIMDGYAFVTYVDVTSPVLTGGVESCPSDYTFVPVTPAKGVTP